MKTLIVDDDSTCQLLPQEILKNYGQCHVAVNGREAVAAVRVALRAAALRPDMPSKMDGHQRLKKI